MSNEEMIQMAQNDDSDTLSIIELVKMNKKPLMTEIRQESEYLNSLNDIFPSLAIAHDLLVKRTMDINGDPRLLIVVPPAAAKPLITRIHEEFAHCSIWRLEEIISSQYYIIGLKSISRLVTKSCRRCVLAQPPTAAKTRSIRTTSGRNAGSHISLDTLHLNNDRGFKYLCVGVCRSSGFIFAKKMKTRNATENANALIHIMHTNNIFFPNTSSDPGTEYLGAFADTCKRLGINHTYMHVLRKNASLAENAIARVLLLLRRELNNSPKWTDSYRKVIYALNCSNMKYGSLIASPNYIMNARQIKQMPHAEYDKETTVLKREESVHNLVKRITRSRLLSCPSLALNVLQRRDQFSIGQNALCWADHVLGKRILSTGSVITKIRQFWEPVTIIDKKFEIYLVQNSNGHVRRVHVRAMRSYPEQLEINDQESKAGRKKDSETDNQQ